MKKKYDAKKRKEESKQNKHFEKTKATELHFLIEKFSVFREFFSLSLSLFLPVSFSLYSTFFLFVLLFVVLLCVRFSLPEASTVFLWFNFFSRRLTYSLSFSFELHNLCTSYIIQSHVFHTNSAFHVLIFVYTIAFTQAVTSLGIHFGKCACNDGYNKLHRNLRKIESMIEMKEQTNLRGAHTDSTPNKRKFNFNENKNVNRCNN